MLVGYNGETILELRKNDMRMDSNAYNEETSKALLWFVPLDTKESMKKLTIQKAMPILDFDIKKV